MASSTSSISGLSSGLDTASLINQFMQLEAIPQTRLKSQLTTQQSTLKTLQALNTKIAALATQAKDLSAAASWSPVTVTSSDAGVTARSTGTAAAGVSLHVDRVATAARVSFAPAPAGDSVVTGPVELTVGGQTHTLSTGSGTPASVAAAINAGGFGVTATTVRLGDGTERLTLQSTATGAATAISLTGVDGLGTPTTTPGQDAQVVIGPDTLTSASNTFTAVSGLEITVSAAAVGKDVEVGVTADATKTREQVKSLVDNLNAVLTQIDDLTKYDAATKTRGPLTGDAGATALRGALFETVFPGDGTSLSSLGVQTDRYGALVFDATAFDTAYAADPAAVTTALSAGTTGFADRIAAAASAASDRTTGSLTTAITGRSSDITRMQDTIESWDLRLELRRSTLTRQFTALETALNQMNSQSAWLAGQLGSLSSSSSS